MIVLIANFRVKPGTEERAKEYVRKMQQHTRQEPGCRMYIGHQSLEDPCHFCFYEQYDDQAAIDAHRAAPYYAEYVTNGMARLAETRQAALYEPL